MSNIPYVFTTGLNNAAEFVASGWPFVQDIAMGNFVDFPWVTNELYLTNTSGATVFVGFTAAGIAGPNRIPILNNTQITLKLKVKRLYVAGPGGVLNVAASLTNVTPEQYPLLVPNAVVAHDLDDDTLSKKYPGV